MRKRILAILAAAIACLAAGCASRAGYGDDEMGYYVTDDGVAGCEFVYSFCPYYNPYAPVARLEIVRIERPRVPRTVDRPDDPWTPFTSSGGASSSPDMGVVYSDRMSVAPAPPPPAPRVVEPRS
ncbi:MAG TPA: hypothetical protein VMR54_07835 [Thermoanaerobaculia bacterium]|nr:hypothetical protein [Thermoanaerobaculia bacterium]